MNYKKTDSIKATAKKAAKKVVHQLGNNWPADNCFFWSYCPKRPKSSSKTEPTKTMK